MPIQDDINQILHAQSGEAVRGAIVNAIQDLNQNGGNAQTLNGHYSDEFTKNAEFQKFIDDEVGQVHVVLDAINKGITLRVIELGTKWIGPEAGTVLIEVPESVKDRRLLTVDDFYADIVEVASGTGSNAHWEKTDYYDTGDCTYTYSYGALASAIKLHFYAKRASATAVQDYNVHEFPDVVDMNATYVAPAGEAYNEFTVNVDVPVLQQEKIVSLSSSETILPDPDYDAMESVQVNIESPSLEQGGVVVNQATYDQTFTPTSPNIGFSEFRVQANVQFNTEPKEVRISDAEFQDMTVVPGSSYAGLSQVSIINDMQLEEVTVNQNGIVEPTSGYAALKKVTVQVPEPVVQRDKAVTLTTNNTTVNVTPDVGKDVMDSVAVTVQVPEPAIETGKSVTYSSGGTYTVNPSSDYTAMDSVEVTVQTPRLQPSKSVTLSQSGTVTPDPGYNAMEEVVVTVSGGGGGNCNIMTKAAWDALTFDQKKQSRLTVIRETGDTTGEWFDYSNVSLPFIIRAELYQNSEGDISLPAMDNAIFFTGAWDNAAGNYDNLKLTATSLTYDSKISGSITPYYYAAPLDKMVTILKNTSACRLNYRNGYSPNGYFSYGAVISVDGVDTTLSILGDYNDAQTHVITTTEAYDGIICITSKGLQNNRGSNGLIEISGTYDSKFDGDEKLISDLTESCITVYSNVAAGAEITISTPLGNRAGSAVIGVKLSHS